MTVRTGRSEVAGKAAVVALAAGIVLLAVARGPAPDRAESCPGPATPGVRLVAPDGPERDPRPPERPSDEAGQPASPPPPASSPPASVPRARPRPAAGERTGPSAARDDWESLPVGDGRNLGPYQSAFRFQLSRSEAIQRVRNGCVYDGLPTPAGSRPTVLVLDVSTGPAGFRIERATVRDPEALDEYQQRCVTQALTGVDLEASGLETSQRYRVTYPIRLGLPPP